MTPLHFLLASAFQWLSLYNSIFVLHFICTTCCEWLMCMYPIIFLPQHRNNSQWFTHETHMPFSSYMQSFTTAGGYIQRSLTTSTILGAVSAMCGTNEIENWRRCLSINIVRFILALDTELWLAVPSEANKGPSKDRELWIARNFFHKKAVEITLGRTRVKSKWS